MTINLCDLEASLKTFGRILEPSNLEFVTEEKAILLNYNTKIVNKIILSYRKSTTARLMKTAISSAVKRSFSSKHRFDRNIETKFLSDPTINTVQDIDRFVTENRNYFRDQLPSRESIIFSLGEIEPGVFNSVEIEYPSLGSRLNFGPIVPAEIDNLITENRLDPYRFAGMVENNDQNIFGALNSMFRGMGIGSNLMGSFCSILDNVYGVVGGQTDIIANAASNSEQFSQIAASVVPRLSEALNQIQEIRSLIQSVTSDSGDMRQNMQQAFSTLSNALGIIMSFFDKNTNPSGGSAKVIWDYDSIRDALAEASDVSTISHELFNLTEIAGRKLGDINEDSSVTSDDALEFQIYIDILEQRETGIITMDESLHVVLISYIEQIFLPYMNDNLDVYGIFSLTSSSLFSDGLSASDAESTSNQINELTSTLSSAASMFGSPSNPSGGDFGLNQLQGMMSQVDQLSSQIQSLQSGSFPVSVDSILSQIPQLSQMAESVSNTIFRDFNELSAQFSRTVDQALEIAEAVSVTDRPRTQQIQESRIEALRENITTTTGLVGRSTNEIVPNLSRELSRLEGLITTAAASGVMENIETQLSNVIEQSASQLRQTISFFTPETMQNLFNFNMESSFSRVAEMISRAQIASSDETVEHLQRTVQGQLAAATERFRERNRGEMEFTAMRFCNLASEIERGFQQFAAPLQNAQERFQTVLPNMEIVGSLNTAEVTRAGGIRYPSSARLQFIEQSATVTPTIARPHVGGETPSGTTTVPPAAVETPFIGNTGPTPRTPDTFTNLPTYQDVTGGGRIRYTAGPRTRSMLNAAGMPVSDGWNRLERSTLALFTSLVNQWGSVTVNSAYRPHAGGGSQHRLGRAFDVSMSDINTQLRFMNLAYRIGFRGFGSYGTFVHIDTGGQRSWTGTGGRIDYISNRGGRLVGPLGDRRLA